MIDINSLPNVPLFLKRVHKAATKKYLLTANESLRLYYEHEGNITMDICFAPNIFKIVNKLFSSEVFLRKAGLPNHYVPTKRVKLLVGMEIAEVVEAIDKAHNDITSEVAQICAYYRKIFGTEEYQGLKEYNHEFVKEMNEYLDLYEEENLQATT